MRNTVEVQKVVKAELDRIMDATRRTVVAQTLIEPILSSFGWDYGLEGQRLDCWLIGGEKNGQVAFAYCEEGFGPGYPWGIISPEDDSLGMDCQWHLRPEDAYIAAGVLEAPPGYEVP